MILRRVISDVKNQARTAIATATGHMTAVAQLSDFSRSTMPAPSPSARTRWQKASWPFGVTLRLQEP